MILRRNVRNSRVLDLQKQLNELGFQISKTGPGSPGNETNFFGVLTENAVKRFQKQNGLKDDGVVGPLTWSKIEEVKNKRKSSDKSVIEDFDDPEEPIIVPRVKETSKLKTQILDLEVLIKKSKISRKVTRLFFHCTASNQNATISGIQKYWRESLGWKHPGYHIIVKPDGSWVQLSDFNNVTNGVKGQNSVSIHVSYIGGIDSRGRPLDNRTDEQKKVLEVVYRSFKEKIPSLTFHGHYEFRNKACPSFNVKEWIKSIEKK